MTTDPSSTGHVNSKIEDKQPLDHKKHQLRMGPAPFASFEDLSDEVRSQRLESPEDKQQYLIRLPGIHEDTTPGGSVPDISDNGGEVRTGGISLIGASAAVPSSSLNVPQEPSVGAKLIPCTPRIDISRASSSSHHEDSKDSTPENQAITALGVGFKEEGALELRSSTEELDFQDHTDAPKSVVKSRPTSPLVFVYDTNFDRQRKDSQTSEICLLSISGRTSRLSSIGSQCSDQSRISTTSHLSVMSGQSGVSRSTSPHKMLLETSFCGSRPNLSEIAQGITEPKEGEILEKVLLSRKHDPTEAILAEGITIETPKTAPTQSNKTVKKMSKNPISKPARTSLQKNKPLSDSNKPQEPSKEPLPSKPTTSTTVPTISVGDTSVPTYVTPEGEKLTPGQVIKSQTGVEYTFIPLKGPLPKDFNKPNSVPVQRRSREPTKTLASTSAHQPVSRGKKLSHSQPPPQSHPHQQKKEPEYIRIKLKPDYMYNEDGSSKSSSDTITEKPTTLDLSYREKPSTSRTASTFAEINKIQSYTASPSSVPKNIHSSLVDQSPVVQSNASPSLSRRSSLFRSRETISPDSSTPTSTHKRKSLFTTKLKEAGDSLKERTRTRSKSREREWSPAMSSNESIDGKMHKQKTSVFSIFKPKKTPTKSKPSSTKSSAENLQYDGITNVEFTFDSFNRPKSKYHEQLLEGDSIRIPLHSPSEYENRTIASAIDSTEPSASTEAEKRKSIEKQESDEKCSVPSTPPERTLKHNTSTSSENVVFSTKLGSNEEIFTTKLPKKPIVFEKDTSALMSELVISKVTSPPKERIVEIKRESSEEKKRSSHLDESKKDFAEEKKVHPKVKEVTKEPGRSKPESKKEEPSKARKEPVQETKEVIEEFTEERREIKIESSKDKEKGKKETPEEERQSSGDKMSSQRIEIFTETVIKTETVTETTPTKTEQITITEKSNIEIKQSPKRDDSEQIPTPSETDNRSSVISTTEKEETSENSEHDSEIEFINKKTAGLPVETKREEPDDQERKTLVFQTDSFEDELPYVPTTLPLERSVAVPIVPIKQRSTFEMKTRPIERPRSTTPINPSTIDDYCGDAALLRKKTAEKLKINLPREDTIEKIQKLKSPRKGTNPRAWQEFAEKGISSHQSTPSSGGSHHAPDSGDEIPPPLPPRSAPKEQIKQWINFEEIPEKHKQPKRIQTIPSRSHIEVPELLSSSSAATSGTETVIYNYVNPEDCQCECHEAALKTPTVPPEEIEPLIQDDDSSDDTIKQSSSSSSQRTKR